MIQTIDVNSKDSNQKNALEYELFLTHKTNLCKCVNLRCYHDYNLMGFSRDSDAEQNDHGSKRYKSIAEY